MNFFLRHANRILIEYLSSHNISFFCKIFHLLQRKFHIRLVLNILQPHSQIIVSFLRTLRTKYHFFNCVIVCRSWEKIDVCGDLSYVLNKFWTFLRFYRVADGQKNLSLGEKFAWWWRGRGVDPIIFFSYVMSELWAPYGVIDFRETKDIKHLVPWGTVAVTSIWK